jgi:hypothetical protein
MDLLCFVGDQRRADRSDGVPQRVGARLNHRFRRAHPNCDPGLVLHKDDFNPAVLRLTHTGSCWNQRDGIAKALDGNRVRRHPIADQLG